MYIQIIYWQSLHGKEKVAWVSQKAKEVFEEAAATSLVSVAISRFEGAATIASSSVISAIEQHDGLEDSTLNQILGGLGSLENFDMDIFGSDLHAPEPTDIFEFDLNPVLTSPEQGSETLWSNSEDTFAMGPRYSSTMTVEVL